MKITSTYMCCGLLRQQWVFGPTESLQSEQANDTPSKSLKLFAASVVDAVDVLGLAQDSAVNHVCIS